MVLVVLTLLSEQAAYQASEESTGYTGFPSPGPWCYPAGFPAECTGPALQLPHTPRVCPRSQLSPSQPLAGSVHTASALGSALAQTPQLPLALHNYHPFPIP